ncbi:MAG: DivIVA domain-containing protein, partial [Oscillospiraceae bacterium]|nr:DivIVA domain-containing protein [Oscillospiraceae bacterium]
MLTPKDISAIKFDKVIVGGYDMGAVDDFLDQVEKDYTALINENNLLKSKMRQLVKKIEEYRSMDDSMRKALSSAQTMAAQIVDKARQEAGTIRAGAQKNGDEILADYQSRIAAEEKKLAMAKASVEDFVSRMTTMYSQGAEMLQTVVGKFAESEDLNIPEVKPVSAAPTHFEPAPPKTPVHVPEPEHVRAPEPEPEPEPETEPIPE